MEVRNEVAVSVYKDALELQKKLMEMLIQQNLGQNLASQQPQAEEAAKTARENIIEGTKVSIYV